MRSKSHSCLNVSRGSRRHIYAAVRVIGGSISGCHLQIRNVILYPTITVYMITKSGQFFIGCFPSLFQMQ